MIRSEPILLLIAPSILLAKCMAQDHGLDLASMINTRTIHRPQMLRGWRAGTAFLAKDPKTWNRISAEAGILSDLLFAAVSRGALRPASQADIDFHKGWTGQTGRMDDGHRTGAARKRTDGPPWLDPEQAKICLDLWATQTFDTAHIARFLGVPEHAVSRCIHLARSLRQQCRGRPA